MECLMQIAGFNSLSRCSVHEDICLLRVETFSCVESDCLSLPQTDTLNNSFALRFIGVFMSLHANKSCISIKRAFEC
jgi:hypothetical protein